MSWRKVADDICGIRLVHYEWRNGVARRTFIAIEHPQISDRYFIDEEAVSKERWESTFNSLSERYRSQTEAVMPDEERRLDSNFALFFKHFAEVVASRTHGPFESPLSDTMVKVCLVISTAIEAERQGLDLGRALVDYVNKGAVLDDDDYKIERGKV